jgi:hypothetical protein
VSHERGDTRRCGDDVLEVIEHEKGMFAAEESLETRLQPVVTFGDTKGCGQHRHDKVCVG